MPGFKSWSPRSTRRNDAASTGSALPPNPRLPGCRRASRSITRSRMSLRLGIAEPEEHASAPYPELPLPGDGLLLPELDQFVEHRAGQPGLQTGAHEDVGRRRAVGGGLDPERVLRPRRHNLVQIGPEDQSLRTARTLLVDGDRDERRIFDKNTAPLGRGHQPKAAVALAAQHGGEQ